MIFGRKHRKPISIPVKEAKEWKYTTCNYCSTGCAIEIGLDEKGKIVTSRGHAGADVNRGKLCIKGLLEHELFDSPGRGRMPLIRDKAHQPFQPASWDIALDRTAAKIKEIQARYGRDAFAVVSTGQLLTEEFYTLGKLVRGQIGTNNYDGNTTLCMASAVSGYKRSFGSDGPPGCYGDFEHTHCLMAFGSNLPEQHPIIYWRLKEALEKRKFPLIVVDPRVTMLAQFADIHLPITPGTDTVLVNAMLHVIFKEGLEDKDYIARHTNGIDALARAGCRIRPEDRAARVRHRRGPHPPGRAPVREGAGGDEHLDDGHQPVDTRLGRRRQHQQPQPRHRQHRHSRRHQLVDHRSVQRDGHARMVVVLGLAGLSRCSRRKPTANTSPTSGASTRASFRPSAASRKPTSSPRSRPARSRACGSSRPIR